MKAKLIARTLALILAAATAVAFAGCSNDQGNSSSSSSAASTGSSSSSEESSGSEIVRATSFNYFGIASGITTEEFNASDMAKMVEEHTGYQVTYDQAPADATDAQTAVMNIFMTKEDYQGVKVTKTQFYSLLAQDALKDITAYVDASTNLKTQISDFGWGTATKDGKVYAIPQKDPTMAASVAIAFRVDWLKEYNTAHPDAEIPVPSEDNGYSMTLTDFKTMLTYFKDKVPQGGKAMAVDINGVYLENILPAFGIYQEWADVDGELTYYVDQPGFADYMAYMEDLFDNDLIIYQATSGDAGAVKMLQSQSVGAGRIPHWNAATIEQTDAHETDDNISYIQALVPDDCKGDASKVRTFAAESYTYYTVIPNFATDEQAAAVIDWADKKLDEDFFLEMVLGTEGETFKIEDGAYYPILPTFDEQRSIADKFLDGTREADYSDYWLCRTRKTAAQNKMFSIANFNIRSVGVKNPITVMPPNDVYDNYYFAMDTEVRTNLVQTLYQSSGRKTLEDIQAVFSANKGEDIAEAVNSWYSGWSEKDTFNPVKPR